MPSEKTVETDVLIIGGGIAGCFAAVKARERGLEVTLVDKAYVGKCGSTHQAGGYYMVFNPDWGHDKAIWLGAARQTGEYLVNVDWMTLILNESFARYRDLVDWGVRFIERDGKPVMTSVVPPFTNVLMPRRDFAPRLRKKALASGVRILDRIMVTDLLKNEGRVVGAIGFPMEDYGLYVFKAKSVVMSAGATSFKPAGQPISFLTGDAEAMAYRAGAAITGKEFRSWNITMTNYPAFRGHANAWARFPKFVDAYGGAVGSLESNEEHFFVRDFVAHAGRAPISWDLDAATPEQLQEIQRHLEQYGDSGKLMLERTGLDISKGGRYPMVGGAGAGNSNTQGEGIWPEGLDCATAVPGLYAAGDCLGGRQSGAGYPTTGFGLAASSVTGTLAGTAAAQYALESEQPVVDAKELARLKQDLYAPVERKGGFSPRWVTQVLQGFTTPYFVMRIQHGDRLRAALTMVEFVRDHLVPQLVVNDAHELRLAQETRNMVLNAEMKLRAAQFRTESRGLHYREDHPRRDDPDWLAWVKLGDQQGRMGVEKVPIPREWWPDLATPYEQRYPLRFPDE